MSEAKPQLSAGRQPRVLSCVLCQRRKIKCDKVIPCANCLKANVTCIPSKPAPPRQRPRPRQDLQDRLARCESLLRQYVDKDESTPPPKSSSGTSPSAESSGSRKVSSSRGPGDGQSQTSTPGKIAKVQGSDRFIDGQLWSSLSDELQHMRDIIDSEDIEGSILNAGEDGGDFSECPSAHSSPTSEEPVTLDAIQILKLWQVYLDRVNPLVKVIHAPTLQPYVVQAASDFHSIPMNYQALLYSIFGLASLALTNDERLQITGLSREKAVHRFARSASISLVRFDFLRKYDMVVVQALLHILAILQTEFNRHAAWVFAGSLIRIAISLGYHRDGQTLNLQPFETEMRRRIWWQIVMYDLSLTLSCGLKHNSIPANFDTKHPLNLNDADLFPDSTGELKSREGPTEMGFVLVLNRITDFMLDEEARNTVEGALLGDPDQQVDDEARQRNAMLIDGLEADLLEIERRFLSAAAGNAHVAALGIRKHFVTSIREMQLPMQQHPEWGTEIFGARENMFKMNVTTSEKMANAFVHMDGWGFSWFMRLHYQLEILTSMTSMMYSQPIGSLTDRAWNIFETLYHHHPELWNMSQRIAVVHGHSTLKAFDAREKAYAAMGQAIEIPSFIVQLRQMLKPASSTVTPEAAMSMDIPTMSPQQPMSFDLNSAVQNLSTFDGSLLTWDFWGGGMGNNNGFIPDPQFRDPSQNQNQHHNMF